MASKYIKYICKLKMESTLDVEKLPQKVVETCIIQYNNAFVEIGD